jgi:hypothetical protein
MPLYPENTIHKYTFVDQTQWCGTLKWVAQIFDTAIQRLKLQF